MPAIPLRGDRSARDMSYPNLHASDIEEGRLRYHTPAPSEAGVVLYSPDGVNWTSYKLQQVGQGGIQTRMTILTFPKDLEVQSGLLRIYNLFGMTQSISKIFLSVSNPSGTNDIIVDVLQNGVSLFTSDSHKPTIVAGEYTGETVMIDRDDWYSENYITADIEQCGPVLTPGSNLTIHIVHTDSSGSVSASAHCYIRGGSEGEFDASAHCYIEAIDTDEVRAHAPCFIETPSWDIDASAPCFIEADSMPAVAHAHSYILPLGYASMGSSLTISPTHHDTPVPLFLQANENITKRQFSSEPEDPDSYFYACNAYTWYPWVFAIKYSGMYEISFYVDGYNLSYVQFTVKRGQGASHSDLIRRNYNFLGTSGGLSSNWRDRSVVYGSVLMELVGDTNPNYGDWVVLYVHHVAEPQRALSRELSHAPRLIIRRLT